MKSRAPTQPERNIGLNQSLINSRPNCNANPNFRPDPCFIPNLTPNLCPGKPQTRFRSGWSLIGTGLDNAWISWSNMFLLFMACLLLSGDIVNTYLWRAYRSQAISLTPTG